MKRILSYYHKKQMSKQRSISFPFLVITFVIGMAIVNEFDFETYRFENLALAIIYILTFGMSVYFLIKGAIGK